MLTPQALYPIADITRSGIQSGTYAGIDEAFEDDSDFIVTTQAALATYECLLSRPRKPLPGTSTISFAAYCGVANRNTLMVSVYEGAIWRASGPSISLPDAADDYSFTADLTAVADWSDLRLRFDFVQNAAGSVLTWAKLTAPAGLPGSGMMSMF